MWDHRTAEHRLGSTDKYKMLLDQIDSEDLRCIQYLFKIF
jgi:hypothetical protein